MTLEQEIQETGRALFARLAGRTPSVFQKDWWSGRMLEWCMRDEAFKVEMFRFVDVFPVLRGPEDIARHLQEYFCREGQDFPAAFQWGVKAVSPGSMAARLAAKAIEGNIREMAGRFIAGADARGALPTLRLLWDEGSAFTVDLLGEAAVSDAESETYRARYETLVRTLGVECAAWPASPRLEQGPSGARVPRVNVSVKVSALHSQLDPIDPDGSVRAAAARLRPILEAAKAAGAFVNLDMEQYRFKDLTLRLFRSLAEEEAFREWEHLGVVVQAYLRDAEEDLRALRTWAKGRTRRAPVTIRLVKGAYWDYETVLAAQQGWPVPVWTQKAATDACYERCTAYLMANHEVLRPALGSHNVRSLAHALVRARREKVPDGGWEAQMLYGMAEPVRAAMREQGVRVRVYAPVGELVPGMAYLVRRLLENTSNESFLRQGFAEGVSPERLLAAPVPESESGGAGGEGGLGRWFGFGGGGRAGGTQGGDASRGPSAGAARFPASRTGQPTDARSPGPFRSEPTTDFADAQAREAFAGALSGLRRTLARGPEALAPRIGGAAVRVSSERVLESVNPARPSEVVARVACAGRPEADAAIAAAERAFPAWRDTAPQARAAVLFRAAELMRTRWFELCALEVLECGKPWREADADVAEAVDFCEYYAREALRLAVPRRFGDEPGEQNVGSYVPRGIVAAITPWNFPLAIPTGMVVAPLVTGNCVVLKPAEQALGIAARLVELLEAAGAPAGTVAYLPGIGEEVGAYLVDHPSIDGVTFTGSRAVGLDILARASVTRPGQRAPRRVVAEMGGKNAIIVDADADVDEAVLGVVRSTFSFAGQKCSACSRVIVVGDAWETFVPRLVEAVRSLPVGEPEDPGIAMGPLIDAPSRVRVRTAVERAVAEGARIAAQREVPVDGFFAPPTVLVDVSPTHAVARDELFGPVLAVLRVETFDAALALADDSEYALTGGLYSRSPERIERARRELRVGNLYLNRPIVGALVGRQPFGGLKMSGIGTKAGGPDYLLQFVSPRVVTENTMRRGFAPHVPGDA